MRLVKSLHQSDTFNTRLLARLTTTLSLRSHRQSRVNSFAGCLQLPPGARCGLGVLLGYTQIIVGSVCI